MNENVFRDLGHARWLIASWVRDYNTERPHSAIGYQTPVAYAASLNPQRRSPPELSDGSALMAVASAALIDPENSTARWGQYGERTNPTADSIPKRMKVGGHSKIIIAWSGMADEDCRAFRTFIHDCSIGIFTLCSNYKLQILL